MNPLKSDDPRHERAVKAAASPGPWAVAGTWKPKHEAARIVDAYHKSLKEQGVVLVEQLLCETCNGEGGIIQTTIDGTNYDRCSRCEGTGLESK